MRIDGKKIAESVRRNLHKDIGDLIARGITPKIAIITLGDESSWESYVRQKLKVADELGIKAVLFNLEDAGEEQLLKLISEIDNDPNYHGIIVQRPMPSYIDKQKVIDAISASKDIDGFRPDSKFEVPVFLAVKKILEEEGIKLSENSNLSFVVLGKGETAGGPISRGLMKLNVPVELIDSKTFDPNSKTLTADVIISCVGKSGVINASNIKEGATIVGVGTHGEDGKIRGDYLESEIEEKASSFTPTPGGVGPINLSFLFQNLVTAAKML